MAYAPYLREMKQIFEGRGGEIIMDNIRKNHSAAAVDYMRNYIAGLADSQARQAEDGLDGMNRLMRGHYPAAVLGWRVSSIIKQAITSPPPFFQHVSIPEYVAAAAECLNEETRRLILEKSVYMKARSYDPALAFVKQLENMYLPGKAGKVEAALNAVERTGMKGLEWIAHVCVMPGWWAAYKQKYAELSRESAEGKAPAAEVIEAEAVRHADQVMRDVQPSSVEMDLAPMFRGRKHSVLRMFLQFQVPMSVIFQNLTMDAPNNVKQGRVFEALTTIGIYAMTAAVVGMMGEEDDEEKLNPKQRAIDALGGRIESMPVVGSGAARTVEGILRTGKIPPQFPNYFPVVNSAGRAWNAAANDRWGRGMLYAADSLFYMTGLPQGLKREIEKAAEAGDVRGLLILLGYK